MRGCSGGMIRSRHWSISASGRVRPASHWEYADMALRLTISRAMLLFGLVTATGLGAVVFTGLYALSDVRVGGPLYDKIKLGNDL